MTKLRLVSRAKLHLVEGSPDQPRDNHGRWTTGGGVSETSDHAAFNKMLSESKRARFLTMHDADDFKQGRAFMLHDVSGDAGMFLTHDGDLRNLVNNDGPGKGSEALKLGVQSGAKTLDCFDGYLPRLYSRYGFVETGRMKFDPDYAPDGWHTDPDLQKRPDVVFMSWQGHDRNVPAANATTYQPSSRYYSGDQFNKAKEDSLRASHD